MTKSCLIEEKIKEFEDKAQAPQKISETMPGARAYLDLVDFWDGAVFQPGTDIVADDYDALARMRCLMSADEYAAACRSDNRDAVATRVHSQLPAEPYHGNLLDASVYILMLNPGAGTFDAEYSKTSGWGWPVLRAIAENSRAQNGKNPYPFYYLDPQLAKTGGGKYWVEKVPGERTAHKLLNALESLSAEYGVASAVMRKFMAQNICGLELFPYHSCRWDSLGGALYNIQSLRLMRDFIAEYIIPRVISGEKSLIVLRQVNELDRLMAGRKFECNGRKYGFKDLSQLPNVCFYTGGQAQAASIGVAQPAGKVLADAIRRAINEPAE